MHQIHDALERCLCHDFPQTTHHQGLKQSRGRNVCIPLNALVQQRDRSGSCLFFGVKADKVVQGNGDEKRFGIVDLARIIEIFLWSNEPQEFHSVLVHAVRNELDFPISLECVSDIIHETKHPKPRTFIVSVLSFIADDGKERPV